MKSSPGGKYHGEESLKVKREDAINNIAPPKVDPDMSVNGAGNLLNATNCDNRNKLVEVCWLKLVCVLTLKNSPDRCWSGI